MTLRIRSATACWLKPRCSRARCNGDLSIARSPTPSRSGDRTTALAARHSANQLPRPSAVLDARRLRLARRSRESLRRRHFGTVGYSAPPTSEGTALDDRRAWIERHAEQLHRLLDNPAICAEVLEHLTDHHERKRR